MRCKLAYKFIKVNIFISIKKKTGRQLVSYIQTETRTFNSINPVKIARETDRWTDRQNKTRENIHNFCTEIMARQNIRGLHDYTNDYRPQQTPELFLLSLTGNGCANTFSVGRQGTVFGFCLGYTRV